MDGRIIVSLFKHPSPAQPSSPAAAAHADPETSRYLEPCTQPCHSTSPSPSPGTSSVSPWCFSQTPPRANRTPERTRAHLTGPREPFSHVAPRTSPVGAARPAGRPLRLAFSVLWCNGWTIGLGVAVCGCARCRYTHTYIQVVVRASLRCVPAQPLRVRHSPGIAKVEYFWRLSKGGARREGCGVGLQKDTTTRQR
ncbi:uncharacterized protein J3D65DRAFT_629817 [Phyllosticta citribraziliensis]|uniref:Uncharacterized protein n=1 Tax=Phyllosticta citribraziliensis TaxID=989973 RepID=A0ABR1LII5_9PEZI